MTQTLSVKDKFQKGFTVFKWELRNCASALIVFGILAAVITAIVFTLSVAVGYLNASEGYTGIVDVDFDELQGAVTVFQYIATYAVYILNAVFTVIYTVRIYSYLHNKRKADLYGALPIGRRTFFIAKSVSAFLFSVVPTLAFFAVIAVLSLSFGVLPQGDVLRVYVQLLLGAMASISFYALLAVCCGTTANAVLCFIAVNIAYPIAALFIKSTIKAFFMGLPTTMFSNSFLMKALNPLAAYDGTNVIYWLFFTAACMALGILLVKTRRAECAQTSFAYFLPAYIVKLLVSFIVGVFLGDLFGAFNVFGVPFFGFAFGFILGSVSTYVIAHLIFYRGFSKLLFSGIALGAMAFAVLGVMAFCCFDFLGYNTYVPAPDKIESAGVVSLSDCCYSENTGVMTLAGMAADDFSDADTIRRIRKCHLNVVDTYREEEDNRFVAVWENMMLGGVIPDWYSGDSYVIAYRLDNGRTVMRCYRAQDGLFGQYYEPEFENLGSVLESETYFRNYSYAMNAKAENFSSVVVSKDTGTADSYYNSTESERIEARDGKVTEEQASADRKKVAEAFRSDFERVGKVESKNSVLRLRLGVRDDGRHGGWELLSLLDEYLVPALDHNEYVFLSAGYTETLQALRDTGAIGEDNALNPDCPYYQPADVDYYIR